DPNIVDLLPKMIWHLDEPVADPAAIATYLICDAARPDAKVLLSGQGGDEVFAGYRVHRNHRLADSLRHLPSSLRKELIPRFVKALPALARRIPGAPVGLMMAVDRYLEKLLAGAAMGDEERYVFYRSY